MVFLTPFIDPKQLWLSILIIQTFLTLLHLLKLYATYALYLQAILREIYILSVVIILFYIQYTD